MTTPAGTYGLVVRVRNDAGFSDSPSFDWTIDEATSAQPGFYHSFADTAVLSPFTMLRASKATYVDGANVLQTVASNVETFPGLSGGTSDGLQCEGARTQLALSPGSNWSTSDGTLANQASGGPDGGAYDRFTPAAVSTSAAMKTVDTTATSGDAAAYSIYLKSTGTRTARISADGTNFVDADLTTTWSRHQLMFGAGTSTDIGIYNDSTDQTPIDFAFEQVEGLEHGTNNLSGATSYIYADWPAFPN
jgi:hypothetical protein